MDTIIAKIRNILEENLITGKDLFTFESSLIFTISEPNVYDVTTVFLNDEEVGSGLWSFDATTNKLTLESGVLAVEGDTVEVQYSYYPNFSDTEIRAFIKNALTHLSINNYSTFLVDVSNRIQPEPTERQNNLISIITSILMRPENRTYRLPDITIQAPADATSKEDKIRKTITIFKKDGHGVFFLTGDNWPYGA